MQHGARSGTAWMGRLLDRDALLRLRAQGIGWRLGIWRHLTGLMWRWRRCDLPAVAERRTYRGFGAGGEQDQPEYDERFAWHGVLQVAVVATTGGQARAHPSGTGQAWAWASQVGVQEGVMAGIGDVVPEGASRWGSPQGVRCCARDDRVAAAQHRNDHQDQRPPGEIPEGRGIFRWRSVVAAPRRRHDPCEASRA